MQLEREFYRHKGIDIDAPQEKTIKRVTFEEKNRQHAAWHLELETFLRDREKQ